MISSAWRGTLAGLAGVLGACQPGAPLVPRSDEPFLYVVLSREPLPGPGGIPRPAGFQSALLLTVGTPLGAEYRAAEHFGMVREGDARRFAWQSAGLSGTAPGGYRGVDVVGGGNFVLPDSASPTGLGRADLVPGAVYVLDVVTGGREVRGRVVLPEAPRLALTRRGDEWVVAWPPVRGAAAYVVGADMERFPPALRTDTSFVLRGGRDPGAVPPDPQARVIALDSNLYRYIADTTTVRAGVTGAFGVVGAASSAAISVAGIF